MNADQVIVWIILIFLIIVIIAYSFDCCNDFIPITKENVIQAQRLAQEYAEEARQMYMDLYRSNQ